MVNFFKNFGKGVLYVLVLPFLLVGLAIYGVVALFVFIFLAIKGLVLFFTGRSLNEDLPEDKEAKRRLAVAAPKPQEQSASVTPMYDEEQATTDTSNQSVDPFYVPEYLKPEEPQEEAIEEEPVEEQEIEPEQKKINEELFDDNTAAPIINSLEENVEDDVISVEQNPQNETIIKISDLDDEDDDNNSGINIDYE